MRAPKAVYTSEPHTDKDPRFEYLEGEFTGEIVEFVQNSETCYGFIQNDHPEAVANHPSSQINGGRHRYDLKMDSKNSFWILAK